MTLFNPANVPSSVTTVEEVVLWGASMLAEINPTATIQTTAGAVEKVATVQTVEFRNQATNPERAVVLLYLPLAPGWRSNGKLFGNGVLEISSVAIPAAYTTN